MYYEDSNLDETQATQPIRFKSKKSKQDLSRIRRAKRASKRIS